MPNHTTGLVCLERSAVSTKSATSTVIATTEDGTRKFYPIFVHFIIDSQGAGTLLTVATASVGITAATYVDILAATALTGLSAVDKTTVTMLPVTALTAVAANTAVRTNVGVAATGTATQTMTVRVFGFYA